jgi:hypothetical protein
MSIHVPHIISERSVTVIVDYPKSITTEHLNYKQVVDMLTKDQVTDVNKLLDMMEPIKELKSAIGSSRFNFDADHVSMTIQNREFVLPEELAKEVLRVYRSEGNLRPLERFVYKLSQNPDKYIHEQLFPFIQVAGLALTQSGNFLAYKRIRENFTDIRTGSMDNSPGATPEEPRFACDSDPYNTCSKGLHFAAWSYLGWYADAEYNRTVIVEVDPADIVAVPMDHNRMKGRAWKYHILKEVETPEELKNIPVTFSAYDDDYNFEDWEEDEDLVDDDYWDEDEWD